MVLLSYPFSVVLRFPLVLGGAAFLCSSGAAGLPPPPLGWLCFLFQERPHQFTQTILFNPLTKSIHTTHLAPPIRRRGKPHHQKGCLESRNAQEEGQRHTTLTGRGRERHQPKGGAGRQHNPKRRRNRKAAQLQRISGKTTTIHKRSGTRTTKEGEGSTQGERAQRITASGSWSYEVQMNSARRERRTLANCHGACWCDQRNAASDGLTGFLRGFFVFSPCFFSSPCLLSLSGLVGCCGCSVQWYHSLGGGCTGFRWWWWWSCFMLFVVFLHFLCSGYQEDSKKGENDVDPSRVGPTSQVDLARLFFLFGQKNKKQFLIQQNKIKEHILFPSKTSFEKLKTCI